MMTVTLMDCLPAQLFAGEGLFAAFSRWSHDNEQVARAAEQQRLTTVLGDFVSVCVRVCVYGKAIRDERRAWQTIKHSPHAATGSQVLTRGAALVLAALALAVLTALCSHRVAAQEPPAGNPEFTRQSFLIVNFTPRGGADLKSARRVGDEVRSRVSRELSKRGVEVIRGFAIDRAMAGAGLNPDSTFSSSAFNAMGRFFRADEYLQAFIAAESGSVQLSGDLVLTRDAQLRQPLRSVRAPTLDSAAQLLTQEIVAARSQLLPQRRCENFLATGRTAQALPAARSGVVAYPRSTLARTCLVWAMRRLPAPARDILTVSQEILALDSLNAHAMEGAAIAYDALGNRSEAAAMWLRFAARDTSSAERAIRVARALNDGRNSGVAEEFLQTVVTRFPADLALTQQLWRAAFDNRHWSTALSAGERLLTNNLEARADSVFYLKLGTVYREHGRPLQAVALLASAVNTFPADARLYALYAQLIRAEADTVIPRGLALFPQDAELLALNARALRANGKLSESLDATRRAMAMDSTLPHGHLAIAQLEFELNRPDSALVSLRRAVTLDRDSADAAQFALARGNTLYRTASASQLTADYRPAHAFLAFADSVKSTTQSQFLSGAAALGLSRGLLNDAAQSTDRAESCRLVQLGVSLLPFAQRGLTAGLEAYASMARQSLDYLERFTPYAIERERSLCTPPAS